VSKERREIIYSVIIIIFIPVLFALNTVLLTSRVRNDTNRTVKRNADQVNTIIAESLRIPLELKNYKTVTSQITSVRTI